MTRDQIHDRIKELLTLIEINHSRIVLNESNLSIDMDQLRQHVVNLYTCLDQLSLPSDQREDVAIDAKPTEEKEVVNAGLQKEEEIPQPRFTPEAIEENVKPPKLEVEPVHEKVSAPVLPKAEVPKEVIAIVEKVASTPEKGDVYAKLRKKKLDSIKKGISISKRYEMQNQLFSNNPDNYNQAISNLDQAGDITTAEQYLDDLAKHYGWNEENPLVEEMTILLQRRFL